jgi:hypothetical protein
MKLCEKKEIKRKNKKKKEKDDVTFSKDKT